MQNNYVITPERTDDELAKLFFEYCTIFHFHRIDYTSCFRDSTGRLVACLLKGQLPAEVQQAVYPAWLRGATSTTDARFVKPEWNTFRENKAGKLTWRIGKSRRIAAAAGGKQGTAGHVRCRPERWNRVNPELLAASTPMVNAICNLYAEHLYCEYHDQLDLASHIPANYHLPGGCFTNFIVNRDHRTPLHYDKADLPGSYSALIAMGDFTGGELLLPQYNIGFDIREGDVLFFNPALLHGNNVLAGHRLSTIFYVRKDLLQCSVGPTPA